MNYFCDSGGEIFHVDLEKVYQGSANANVINFFGAFPHNCEVLIAYELPDGTWTTPKRMTPIAELTGAKDKDGNTYAVWQTRIGAVLRLENGVPVKDKNGEYVYDLDYSVTEHYGTVNVQFYVYANAGNGHGAQIATASSSFIVSKGVPIVLPDTPTDDYEQLLAQILSAIADKNDNIDKNAEDIQTLADELINVNVGIGNNGAAIEENAQRIKEIADDVTAMKATDKELEQRVGSVETNVDEVYSAINSNVGKTIGVALDDEYKLTLTLYAENGALLSRQQVDFPVESMVVNGAFDADNKKIVLTLQNGNTVEIPVGSLVDGLISTAEKGQANGVATLGSDGKVPAEQLPEMGGGGETPDLSEYVKFTDYATASMAGVVKPDISQGIGVNDGVPFIFYAQQSEIDKKTSYRYPITPIVLDYAVKVGLTTNTETLTDEEKASACDWLGAMVKPAKDTGGYMVIPAFNDKGEQVTVRVSYSPLQYALAPYTTGGILVSNTPTSALHCANKQYVDDGFVAIEENTESVPYVYTDDKNYKHYLANVDSKYKVYNIPMIFGSTAGKNKPDTGYLLTNDPVNAYHCANKQYVDENKGTKLYKHDITNGYGGQLQVISLNNTAITAFSESEMAKLKPYIGVYVNGHQCVGTWCNAGGFYYCHADPASGTYPVQSLIIGTDTVTDIVTEL